MKRAHLSAAKRVRLAALRLLERWLLRPKIDAFYRVAGGHIFFQTLAAAVELDLFSLIREQGPLTAGQLADRLSVEDKPLRILLLGCTSIGLLKKRGSTYANTATARRMLTRQSPQNVLPIIRWQHHINYKALWHFEEAIRQNRNVGLECFEGNEPTLYQRLVHQPELEQIFQDAMESISTMSNHLLTETIDFSDYTSLLDVGGGNGTNIMQICRNHPNLKARVFDSPTVCEIAREHFASEGMADRCGAVPGNCFEDPFPEGVDCILFCHFMTIWSEEKNRLLIRKACDALPEGGAVMVFNMMQDNDETGPLTAAIGSPYFLTLATGEGMLYTWAEYEQWMRDAGFREVVTHRLVRDHGVIIGIK